MLSRRRTDKDGRFAGVVVISISPDYFHDYYATLPQPIVAALTRADGLVLARFPEPRAARRPGTIYGCSQLCAAVRSQAIVR